MGCFSLSCNLTHTEIAPGDEVFVAFLKPTWELNGKTYLNKFNVYDVMTGRTLKELNWKRNETCGNFLYIGVDQYDDYGLVPSEVEKEYDKHNVDWWQYQFICHKRSAEALLERKLREGLQLEEDFYDLLHRMYVARVQLNHGLLGTQHLYDQEELDYQNILHKETGRMLKIKQQQLNDLNKELYGEDYE